jgi:uncharacterized membrane protein
MPMPQLLAFAVCVALAAMGVVLLRATGELTHRVLGWVLLLVAAVCAVVVTLATIYTTAFPNS